MRAKLLVKHLDHDDENKYSTYNMNTLEILFFFSIILALNKQK